MPSENLSIIGGEFRDAGQEARFQAERCPETARHARLLFILSALLNTLFLASDWRFHGTEHFFVAVPARLAVVAVSLGCFLAALRPADFPRLQRLMLTWEGVTAVGVGFLVSSRSDLALFVVLMLPSIFYLVMPTAFRWTVAMGVGCSTAMLVGYLSPVPLSSAVPGLVLGVLMLNFALGLVVTRSNRLRRLEWSATLAERRVKEELAESRRTLERMFMAVPIPLVVTARASGRIVNANDAAYEFFGRTRETLDLDSIEQVYVEPSSRRTLLGTLARDGRVAGFETRMRLADGAVRDVLMAAAPLDLGAGDGQGLMAGVVDITDRKAAEARERHAATHDSLTGLPNRAHFHVSLDRMLAEAEAKGGRVGILLIDVDEFKEVNDTLGHDAGDMLLVEVGRRLAALLPPGGFVARLGGDEFVLLVGGDLAFADVVALATRLLDGLKHPIGYGDLTLSVRASVGVAAYPDHDRDPIELLKDADLAVYAAKGAGRARVAVYDIDLRRALEQRVALARDVADALAEGRIVPFYQPRIDIASGAVVGFEALARWRHPDRGLLAPGAFAAAFEHPELAIAIGDAMVRQVAADMREWQEAGLDFGRVAVNLSTVEFRDQDLAERVLDVLAGAGVPAGRFGIEVTETVFLARCSSQVAEILARFHARGVRIALDDFGTGFASLTHLKQFPIDEIKIDRSFVADIEVDADDATIVTTVIELGRRLGMDVIAEGVETAGQAEFLALHGCGYAQGFGYAKPMAASRVANFLKGAPYRLDAVGTADEALRA